MQLTGADLLSNIKSSRSILLWGPPVTGKTYSLATLVQWLKTNNLGPLHHWDLDNKSESLVKKLNELGLLDHLVVHNFKAATGNKIQPGLAPARDTNTYMSILGEFNKYYDMIDPRTQAWKTDLPFLPPGAVCFDSLSKLNDIIFDFVIGKVGHEPGAEGTDFRQDSVKIMAKIEECIDSLLTLPCTTILTAHEQYTKDDVQGTIFNLPKVLGKHSLAPALARKFNCVMFSDVEGIGVNAQYKWIVRPNPAKSVRSAGLTSSDNHPPTIPQDYRIILG